MPQKFKCDECDKEFRSQNTLRIHKEGKYVLIHYIHLHFINNSGHEEDKKEEEERKKKTAEEKNASRDKRDDFNSMLRDAEETARMAKFR